jgi:hypothetical protein
MDLMDLLHMGGAIVEAWLVIHNHLYQLQVAIPQVRLQFRSGCQPKRVLLTLRCPPNQLSTLLRPWHSNSLVKISAPFVILVLHLKKFGTWHALEDLPPIQPCFLSGFLERASR